MLRTRTFVIVGAALLAACAGKSASNDAEYAALQERGEQHMGVDQNTSTHRFDALPDGGRIELQRDEHDPEAVASIREHLRTITRMFTEGDFSTPMAVHLKSVPGANVMEAKRAAIRYEYSDLPRGGQVRIITRDAEALAAVHEFIAFQRQEHRAGGHGPGHSH